MTSDELDRRGTATLLACWEAYAAMTDAASLHRLPGVVIAHFPNEPESAVFNNAIVGRGVDAAGLDAIEETYGDLNYAVWVDETDRAMQRELERRGYVFQSAECSMGMTLDEIRVPLPDLAVGPPDWGEHARVVGMGPDFLEGADLETFHVLLAVLGGENVATTMAFDLDGDAGIYNVGTLEYARRRGLATALTALTLHAARTRGCSTASLQATSEAERIYAAAGFRELARNFEYVPQRFVNDGNPPRGGTRRDS
jgi:ribosomal protein S18 acetylase RimI-like enzyme